MKNISFYVKENPPEKLDTVQTSVIITRDQKKFVDEKNLNLSAMVRDMLTDAMTAKPAKAKG